MKKTSIFLILNSAKAYKEKGPLRLIMSDVNLPRSQPNFISHPLIHTLLKFSMAPYIESQSLLLRFWQLTPINRTHFILWPDQWCELALRAFGRVDFGSLNIVRV